MNSSHKGRDPGMHTRPVLIVLAAGRGSRFVGTGHKLLQPLADSTVLGMTLRHAVASHLSVVVVTTAALADLACRHVASRDIVVLPAVDSAAPEPLGIGFSIAAGVAARAHASGWLLLPGDMPLVRPESMVAVSRQLGEHPVSYAQHRGRQGHPVGFAAELYSELVVLSGDEGAHRLLARYPAHPVEVDDPGVLIDIDTTEDLARARALRSAAITPQTEAQPEALPARPG
jgi:molybdenum cofactor cytidylyltransferase